VFAHFLEIDHINIYIIYIEREREIFEFAINSELANVFNHVSPIINKLLEHFCKQFPIYSI